MTTLTGKTLLLVGLMGTPTLSLRWTYRHMLPLPVGGGAAGFVGGKLTYAGGTAWRNDVKQWLNQVHIYDPRVDKWTEGPSLPVPLAYGAFANANDSLVVLGGSDGKKTHRECWVLDAAATSWKSCGTAPGDTLLGRAEATEGRIYLFGGCSDVADLTRCSDALYQRSQDGKWSRVSTLPQGAVAMPAKAMVGRKVYLFGGCSMPRAGALRNRDDAYAFDTTDGSWKKLRPLPHPNRGMSAAAIDNRHIVLYGGYSASPQEAAGKGPEFGFTADVLVYDTETDNYEQVGQGPLAAAGVELLYHSGVLFGVGGEHRMRGRSDRLLTSPVKVGKSRTGA